MINRATIPGLDLARALRFAAGKDDTRGYLKGVWIVGYPNGRNVIAGTDGCQLYIGWLEPGAVDWKPDAERKQFGIPVHVVRVLAKAAQLRGGRYADVELTAEGSTITATIAHGPSWPVTPLEGVFPDVRRVDPVETLASRVCLPALLNLDPKFIANVTEAAHLDRTAKEIAAQPRAGLTWQAMPTRPTAAMGYSRSEPDQWDTATLWETLTETWAEAVVFATRDLSAYGAQEPGAWGVVVMPMRRALDTETLGAELACVSRIMKA